MFIELASSTIPVCSDLPYLLTTARSASIEDRSEPGSGKQALCRKAARWQEHCTIDS